MIKIVLPLLLFCFSLASFAQIKTDNYSVIVPVDNQSEPQRQTAFSVALHELVDTNASFDQTSDLNKLFEHPELYVESYSYQSDFDQEDGLKIVVQFDPAALSPFFQPPHGVQSQSLNLQISGVTSVQVLNAIVQCLNQIKTVKSVMIEQVNGESVKLSFILQGNIDNFIQTFLSDQRFISMSAVDSQDQFMLRFKWVGV